MSGSGMRARSAIGAAAFSSCSAWMAGEHCRVHLTSSRVALLRCRPGAAVGGRAAVSSASKPKSQIRLPCSGAGQVQQRVGAQRSELH